MLTTNMYRQVWSEEEVSLPSPHRVVQHQDSQSPNLITINSLFCVLRIVI